MCDINDKLSKCKISNNKKNEFIIDSVKFTILNLTKKKDHLDK